MYRPLPEQLTIKNSPIEGLGLFATKDIKADEEVFVDYGKRILASDRRKFLFGF